MKKQVVYITGCLGFIGSHITKKCLDLGWQVRGIDKVTYASNIQCLDTFSKNKNFVFDKVDINDISFLYDCDYIINTAAETHVDNSIVKSDDFVSSNVKGVHNLLEMIRKMNHFKMPTLLHISTDEVYGDILNGKHTEIDLLKPSNPYSATKAAADMLILAWARTYNVPYIIVRPSNNYGTRQYIEKLIPKACKFISIGRKIPLHNNGNPIRTWLHADDTADAILSIIETGTLNEIFNISGDFEQSNIETIKKIIACYFNDAITNVDVGDIKRYIDFSVTRKGQDVRYSIDDTKLRITTGWKPKINFDDSLPEIVDYYKNTFVW